jgi:hypothetical protein
MVDARFIAGRYQDRMAFPKQDRFMGWMSRREAWNQRRGITVRRASRVGPSTLSIPPYPAFSPAAVAKALQRPRDNVGARYVVREEVVSFVQDYLKRPVT